MLDLLIKDKYIVVFVSDVSGIPTVIGKRRLKNPNQKEIRYKNKTWIINSNIPTYRRGKRFLYFMDMDKGQRNLEGNDIEVSPKLMDQIFHQEIVGQIVSKLSTGSLLSGSIIIILMGIGLGITVGYIIGSFFPMGGT